MKLTQIDLLAAIPALHKQKAWGRKEREDRQREKTTVRERAWHGMVTAGKNNFDKMLLREAKGAEARNAQKKRNPIANQPSVLASCCRCASLFELSREERTAATETELTICATPSAPSGGRT